MTNSATAPINITTNYDSICDLKCDYSFKYPLSNLNLINKGNYVYITPENFNETPVSYNSNKYNVKELRLYRKSLHTYGGKNADAELLIVHNNINGSEMLVVSIPIMIGASNPKSIAIFDTLIGEMAKTANSAGKQTFINNPSFTLDTLIPMKSYYSYNGSLPYSPFNGEYDYVVFNIDNAISISSSAFKSFSSMISESTSPTTSVSNGLFFNKKGPTYYSPGGKAEDIYIECLPTGSSGEVLIEKDKSNQPLFNNPLMKDFLNHPFLKIIFGAFMIIAVMFVGRMLFSMLTSTSGAGTGGAGTGKARAGTGGAGTSGNIN